MRPVEPVPSETSTWKRVTTAAPMTLATRTSTTMTGTALRPVGAQEAQASSRRSHARPRAITAS